MADLLKRGGPERVTLDDQARKAVEAFRSIQPTLTAYARVLTGRKEVRVVAAAADNGSTDGTRINFRPPISLGDPTPHNRHLCDRRDEVGLHLCPACKIREEVLVTIYHEIAHICFDSFAETTDLDKKKAIEFAIKETADSRWAKKIEVRINSAPSWKTKDYINLMSLINGYLPFLLNALEDARVNAALFRARPGVKRMFVADERRIFEEGFEGVNPLTKEVETQKWSNAPLNSQAMIACYCKASGYDFSEWFHPKVVNDLSDEKLTSLIRQIDTARSAAAVYNVTFRVFARLRELGYFGTEEDPDPEPPQPEPEQGEEQPDESDSSEGESSDSDTVPPESPSSGDDGDGSDEGTSADDEASEEGEAGQSESSDDESSGDSEEGESSDSSGGSGQSEDSSQDRQADSDEGDLNESSERSPEADQGSDESDESGDSSSGRDESDSTSDMDEEDHLDESQSSGYEGDLGDDDGERSQGLDSGGDDSGEAGSEADSTESPSMEGSSSEDSSVSEDDDEPIDSGADDGYGGTESNQPLPPMGNPDDIDGVLELFGNHEEKPKSARDQAADKAIDTAVIQGIYFTTPSTTIEGVREHYYGKPLIIGGLDYSDAWRNSRRRSTGAVADIDVPESILQPALLRTRRAFTDNKRGAYLRNKKSGRVNAATLGRRAWNDDPRLFHKRVLPGKKDYFVVIGMDVSGSTVGLNLALEKRAIMAQATLLDRVGIPFAIYGHTGNYADASPGSYLKGGMSLEVYHIKDPNEPWSSKEKERLSNINHSAANLDGHALEYLRKVADTRPETDKIILYYSDGKMPAENFREELEILRREIQECKKKNYTLLGVGIRTDSPKAHGLDTVEVWKDEDLVKVVDHLNKRLSGTNRR